MMNWPEHLRVLSRLHQQMPIAFTFSNGTQVVYWSDPRHYSAGWYMNGMETSEADVVAAIGDAELVSTGAT